MTLLLPRRKGGWGYNAKYADYCTMCTKGIKPDMISTDARVEGKYHPRCLFRALKKLNPHYRKLA